MPDAKPGFLEWLANKFGLPFALPKLALPQTIKNADKALGRLIAASLDNVAGRIERNTSLRAGRTDAELDVVKGAAGQLAARSKTDPYLTERSLEYAFGETVLRQKSREQVGRLTLEHLNTTAQAEAGRTDQAEPDAQTEIDDDWLNAFSDHVSSKSNADIQSLWAKILANEIRKPRSFSLQSLRLLADLSAEDARLLHDKILPLVVAGHMIFSQGLPDLTEFIRAQELGVVSGAAGIGLSWNVTLRAGTALLLVGRRTLVVDVEKEIMVNFPSMMLTRFGSELLQLSQDYPPPPDDYVDRLIKFLGAKEGVKVRKA
jgi:predicted 3-demethylubiquinone-9 3-methyltransferase (glyoxalase superfamily)